MILKEDVKKLVELFYRHNFKLFYINSLDGKTFEKSEKIFISLGITTNIKTLKYVSDSIKISSNYKYKSSIAEIVSNKIEGTELYMNSVVKVGDENDIIQYDQVLPSGAISIFDVPECIDKLRTNISENENIRLVESDGLREEVSELNVLYEKYKDQSNIYLYKENGEWKPFYEKVNYRKDEDGKEYRIGILVEQ
jgi:hypothetical protein